LEKKGSFGNGNFLMSFFFGGGGDSNTTVGLQLIAEKMKINSCLPVGKCPYLLDVF